MTKPSLREVIGRLGPIQAVDLVRSGSPARVDVRPAGDLAQVNVATAVHALIRRGVRARAALDALEQMIEGGEAGVVAPFVEVDGRLASELRDAGVEAIVVMVTVPVEAPSCV